MISLSINNKPVTVQVEILELLLAEQAFTPPFAVAINGNFIPKSQYATTALINGDKVDIVSPIFGG